MLSAEHIIWMGEPPEADQKYFKKYGFWKQWTIWPYKAKFVNKKTGVFEECPTTFYMDEEAFNIYQSELSLLEKIRMVVSNEDQRGLIDLIEKYGNMREEKGREAVQEAWAESDAGESI